MCRSRYEADLAVYVVYFISLLYVGQGMKQTKLYLWNPLFQGQWDICDQQNHKIYNKLVKGHNLYSYIAEREIIGSN